MSVVLKTGDPAGGPATFTRFALPFRYALQPIAVSPATRRYGRAVLTNLASRRKYYTPETSTALFKLTKWYELQDAEKHPVPPFAIQLRLGTRVVEARLRPTIVLFEARRRGPSDDDEDDALHTGFLLVDLSFPSSEQPLFLEDLQLINEYFRYWRPPFDGHAEAPWTYSRGGVSCTAPYREFVSSLRSVSGQDYDDAYFDRWSELLTAFPLSDKAGTFRLFPSKWDREARAWARDGDGPPGWIASTDERAFVWTCALTEGGSGALAWKPDSAWRSGAWVRLLNVDKPSKEDATAFEEQWAEPRTYNRWQHWGTLYGFNGHAGAMMAAPIDRPPLWRHFGELYFDQMLLLLYLRTTIFRLSHRLSELYIGGGHRLMEQIEAFRTLRDRFARFANLYQFPLLSNQQQGLEMYAIARKALDIKELFEEIETQIETTHEYLELRIDAKNSGSVTWLTIVATIAVVMTLMLTAEPIRDPLMERLEAITTHPRLVLDLVSFSVGGILAFLMLRLQAWFR